VCEPTQEDGDFLTSLLGGLEPVPGAAPVGNIKVEPGLAPDAPEDLLEKSLESLESPTTSSAVPEVQRPVKRKTGPGKPDEKGGDGKDCKKQRRLIRNRMSAQLHRERKKAYLDQLEAQLKQKDVENMALKARVEQLTTENSALKSQLQHVNGGRTTPSGYSSSTTTASESSPSPPPSPPQLPGSPGGLGFGGGTTKKAAMILFSVTMTVLFIGDSTTQHNRFQKAPLGLPPLAIPASGKQPSRFAHGGRVLTAIDELESEKPGAAAETGYALQLYPSHPSYTPSSAKSSSTEAAKPGKLRGAKLPVNATIPTDISDSELDLWLRNFSQHSSSTQQDNAEFTKLANKYTFGNSLDSSFILCPKAFGTINIWSSSVGPFGGGSQVLFDAKAAHARYEAEDDVEDDGDVELLDDEEMQLANAHMFGRAARRDEVDNSRALAMKDQVRESPPVRALARKSDAGHNPAPLHKRVEEDSSPYMVLMMPSSSVRWNGNPLKVDGEDNETKTEADSDSWLEIGVKLVHARVVSRNTVDNRNYAI
jgi:hypothetical protein